MNDSRSGQEAAPPRMRWLGFLTLPKRMRRDLLGGAGACADRLRTPAHWVVCGVLLGSVPLAVDYACGMSLHRWLVPVAILPFLVAAAARDQFARAACFLGALVLTHGVLAITLANLDPERMGVVLPGGAAYWEGSRRWIAGADHPEYELARWLPAQLQLFGGFLLFAYLSLGMTPLWQGFYELGLMHYYVGQLAANSADPWLAIALGWHPWSLCRGVGYLILTFEIASLALEHMTASRLSTPRRRLARWSCGLTFLGLDMIVKYATMDTVREVLADNLL